MCTAVADPLTGLYTATAFWDSYNLTETIVTNMNYRVIVSLVENRRFKQELLRAITVPLLVSETSLLSH